MKPGISLHLMTRNPPMDRLAALIAFAQPYVGETVIVNTGMPDEHRSRILGWNRQNGIDSDVVVIDTDFVDFASTRNRGLEHHRHEWTLVLDTDELPSAAMMAHAVFVTSEQGRGVAPEALGYLYLTYGWEEGVLAAPQPHDWHTRLFRTEGSYFFRPVHELVVAAGEPETTIRNSVRLPQAPASAFLIHSYFPDRTGEKQRLYDDLGQGRL